MALSQEGFTDKPVSIIEALELWEEQYELILNYDFDMLSGYHEEVTLPNVNAEYDLSHILIATPYDFIKGTEIYTLYLSENESKRICAIVTTTDGNPLPYASVQIMGTPLGTISDSIGRFNLEIDAIKNDRLRISFIGFEPVELYVSQVSMGCPKIILHIDQDLYLSDVVIRDYLMQGISISSDHGATDINYDVITTDHTSTEHDILSFLQLLPGVSSTDDSATNLNIRGSSADQNLILWENTTIYDPGHLFGMISSINPYAIDHVNLYKGIYDPKYENRVGGLINMSMPSEVPESSSYSLGTSLTEGHMSVAVPILGNTLGMFLSGRHGINSLVETRAFNNYFNKEFQNTKVESDLEEASEGIIDAENQLRFSDLNAKLIFEPTDRMSSSISYLQSSNTFNFTSDFPGDDFISTDALDYSTEAFTWQTTMEWSKKMSSSISYSRSAYNNSYTFDLVDDIDDQVIFGLSNTNRIQDASFSFNNELALSDALRLDLGYIRDKKDVQYDVLEISDFEPQFMDTFNQVESFNHIYSSIQINSNDHDINLSFKASNPINQGGLWAFSPRVFYSYLLQPSLQIKASAGRVYQFITQNRDLGITDINSSTNLWLLSDLDRDNLLYADKYSLGLVYAQSGWLVDIDLYRNNTRNLSIINSAITDPLNLENSLGLNATGVELLVKRQWDQLGFWVNYALSENSYVGSDIFQATPSEIDQRHRLSLVTTFDISDFRLNLTYQYKSGLPYTQPSGIASIIDDDDIFYEFEYANGINQAQLSDYHRLDLSISFNRRVGKHLLQSSLSLINLTNYENVAELATLVDEDEDDFGNVSPVEFILEKRLLGFTPRLMVRLVF